MQFLYSHLFFIHLIQSLAARCLIGPKRVVVVIQRREHSPQVSQILCIFETIVDVEEIPTFTPYLYFCPDKQAMRLDPKIRLQRPIIVTSQVSVGKVSHYVIFKICSSKNNKMSVVYANARTSGSNLHRSRSVTLLGEAATEIHMDDVGVHGRVGSWSKWRCRHDIVASACGQPVSCEV